MKAAFLTSSLIASKGKAAPASPRLTPKNLLDDDKKGGENHVSRIYDRVREYAEPHHDEPEETTPETSADTASDATRKTPEATPDNISPAFMTRDSVSSETTRTGRNGVSSLQPEKLSTPPASRDYSPVSTPKPAMNGTSPRPEISPIGEEKAKEIAEEVSKLKKDGLGRIRISVRMAPKDHLQLKLIAAHTQMSAQSIFETALEEYVANHGSEILPQSCNCVLDKSSL